MNNRKPEDYAWWYIVLGGVILALMFGSHDINPYVFGYLLVAFGVYLGIGFVAICIYLAWYFWVGRLIAPVKTARARVYFKTDHRHGIEVPERLQNSRVWEWVKMVMGHVFPGPVGSTIDNFDYIVEFQVGGRIEEFAVPEEIYGTLSVGDEGVLTYKGTKLISFSAEASGP